MVKKGETNSIRIVRIKYRIIAQNDPGTLSEVHREKVPQNKIVCPWVK